MATITGCRQLTREGALQKTLEVGLRVEVRLTPHSSHLTPSHLTPHSSHTHILHPHTSQLTHSHLTPSYLTHSHTHILHPHTSQLTHSHLTPSYLTAHTLTSYTLIPRSSHTHILHPHTSHTHTLTSYTLIPHSSHTHILHPHTSQLTPYTFIHHSSHTHLTPSYLTHSHNALMSKYFHLIALVSPYLITPSQYHLLHLLLLLQDPSFSYAPGDALSFIVPNPSDEVDLLLQRLEKHFYHI